MALRSCGRPPGFHPALTLPPFILTCRRSALCCRRSLACIENFHPCRIKCLSVHRLEAASGHPLSHFKRAGATVKLCCGMSAGGWNRTRRSAARQTPGDGERIGGFTAPAAAPVYSYCALGEPPEGGTARSDPLLSAERYSATESEPGRGLPRPRRPSSAPCAKGNYVGFLWFTQMPAEVPSRNP